MVHVPTLDESFISSDSLLDMSTICQRLYEGSTGRSNLPCNHSNHWNYNEGRDTEADFRVGSLSQGLNNTLEHTDLQSLMIQSETFWFEEKSNQNQRRGCSWNV